MKKFLSIVCVLIVLLTTGCSKKRETIRIAATRVPHAEMLEFATKYLHWRGIDLEITILDDYEGANKDLAESVIDANFFQHQAYLDEQIAEFHYPIQSLVGTHIEPMQFYSSKVQLLSELPHSGVIAVPSDSTNLSRALNLLAINGVIKVKSNTNRTKLTMKDVVPSKENYYLFAMDASELPTSLETVDLAVIPGNFALQAGLTPIVDTVILEDNIQEYVNVVVIRAEDANQKRMAVLKKAMTSKKMRKFILEKYNGIVIPVF